MAKQTVQYCIFCGHRICRLYCVSLRIRARYDLTFRSKIWDTHTGECLHTLQHNHIVRSVAFVPGPVPNLVATGGFEKKLRVFDMGAGGPASSASPTGPDAANVGSSSVSNYEIGPGVHGGTIKSILWGPDSNIITTAADDKKIRWWDVRQSQPIAEYLLDGPLGSCELNAVPGSRSNQSSILSVSAGKSAYFFSGSTPGHLLTSFGTAHEIASVAVNYEQGKFVTGGSSDTWVRVYDLNDGKELTLHKGHHGPVWSTNFAPDGKLYATGSEDGTIKLWKFCSDPYGLWR